MIRLSIINIGNELLSGRTLNSHQKAICEAVGPSGVIHRVIACCSDELPSFAGLFVEALLTSDIIIVTGGLGPTQDDRTAAFVAKILSRPLAINNQARALVRQALTRIGRKMDAYQLKQSLLPRGSRPIPNSVGIAPGIDIIWNDTRQRQVRIYVLPGPPKEMYSMLRKYIVPSVQKISGQQKNAALLTLNFPMTAESEIAPWFEKQSSQTFSGIQLGFYPQPGMVKVVLSGGSDMDSALKITAGKFADRFFFEGDIELYRYTLDKLIEEKLTIASAESCTGGLFSDSICSLKDASKAFLGGFICYANEFKNAQLGVDRSVINRYGAVSSEVARDLAESARLRVGSDIGVSFTGIAGPSGGHTTKPVGTVFIGISTLKGTAVSHMKFSGSRNMVRNKSVIMSHLMLHELMANKIYNVTSRVGRSVFKSAHTAVSDKKFSP